MSQNSQEEREQMASLDKQLSKLNKGMDELKAGLNKRPTLERKVAQQKIKLKDLEGEKRDIEVGQGRQGGSGFGFLGLIFFSI